MCLFPYYNNLINSKAYKKGLREFDCGACPECLAKRSRLWALRCSAQSQIQHGCMVTLTYDNYVYDENGNIIGEQVADRKVDKRDCQLFIKRLRKYFNDYNPNRRNLIFISKDEKLSKLRRRYKFLVKKYNSSKGISIRLINEFLSLPKKINSRLQYIKNYNNQAKEFNKNLPNVKISYLLTAEYGKRTHRPHYHAILFGVDFADRVFYKKSKRGNIIYKSSTLTKLWSNGICTVDSVNLNAKTARYCTKYCAKDSRTDDTFMLVSRGIGDEWLLKNFNGLSYMLDGREYTIPKLIWNKYIANKYKNNYVFKRWNTSYKYLGLSYLISKGNSLAYELADFNRKSRHRFQSWRDKDIEYQRYLAYWFNKNEYYNQFRPTVSQRVLALPNDKYYFYKVKALQVLGSCEYLHNSHISPRSNCVSRYNRYHDKFGNRSFALDPLVIIGQMTPKTTTKLVRCGYRKQKRVYLQEYNLLVNPFEESK